ncbi:hypothetical protein ETU08_02160 [Apibacter muscae]|uniref:hypothetical protein n=1 Tax=Apibacter muscae TaxID=2509004 RepID=UPI0011AC8449|nr:hypothetical protein [Apibacter muscae]TWP30830.1 hypothetical protein ETU08_02160 [Apibacter muscae]
MKFLAIFLFTLLLSSCQRQETSTSIETIFSTPIQPKDSLMGNFNIQKFNKHQKNDEWEYIDKDGNEIRETYIEGDGYVVDINYLKYPFSTYKFFNTKGIIKTKGNYFHGNGFNKGIWTDYDEKGNIIKQTDYDAPYKDYPWEKVRVWMESKNIDLMDPLTSVGRNNDNDKPIWYISWSIPLNEVGTQTTYNVEIDGKTGKIIKESSETFDREG